MIDDQAESTSRVNAAQSNWPALLRDLVDVLSTHFTRRGNSPGKASGEAKAAVQTLAKYFGGRQIYLPKGARLDVELRDQDIYQRFNGANKLELAAEFSLTSRSIEQIVKAQVARRRNDRSEGARND